MTEDKVHNPWILLTDYCEQKKISRNTCYKWINKGELHRKMEKGRTYVCNASSIIDVEFTPVTGDSQSDKTLQRGDMSAAIIRMTETANIMTQYMRDKDKKIRQLAKQNGKLKEQVEYLTELTEALSERLNPSK